MAGDPPQFGQKIPIQRALLHIATSLKDNFTVAVRLAMPWLALIALFSAWAAHDHVLDGPDLKNLEFNVFDVFVIAINIMASASIAVSWHRFILRDIDPQTVPHFRIDLLVLRYALANIMLALVIGVPLGILAKLADALPLLFLPGLIAISMLAIVVMLRLSLKLVAIALENHNLTYQKAYGLTRSNNLAILAIIGALLTATIIAVFVPEVLVQALGHTNPKLIFPMSILLRIPAQFLLIMLSTTMLTTLYGFFVEGRRL